MAQLPRPWPKIPLNPENFSQPPREYGILPFWFLNGELDPDEMRFQLKEFREKGMPGIILHGRYGLEMPYIGEKYLDRVRFAVEEAKKIGLETWIYDEMNWPSGTADQRVLKSRPDLAQRYIECLSFTVQGPWFTYLTGADSRYIDFERSKPVAAFALSLGGGSAPQGKIIDLTPNLSFENVIPWEAPPGMWRLMYIVEKQADYYIDALNPEATREFLRLGYEPYAQAVGANLSGQMRGFYTDEPAMHYYVSGGDNPIVPWTKDMFKRFQERNGYNLRPRLPDLFFDTGANSARVRYDFYTTLTAFYSAAYYQQISEWCGEHGVLFTGHLLYEEWLRKLVRVEGNIFKHYPHMHVIGVDHLYPFTGGRDRPDEHVAMKVGSSAAHQLGSPRLLCESFGGIFMDATMQRMKWIADWEYVLGVNLLNPHGFHYTLEGPRKRDWPPSQFYQYPWWRYYGEFSKYMSRLSHLLSGGRHVAKAAVLWPLNSIFASYTPQSATPLAERTVSDFNALTDLLLRVHYDFDYLDEDILAGAAIEDGCVRVADEDYPLIILPPITHLKIETLDRLEQFVRQGGRVLGTIFLPDQAFTQTGLVDIRQRVADLFGVDPVETQSGYTKEGDLQPVFRDHETNGKTAFLRSYALSRGVPKRFQQGTGTSAAGQLVIEGEGERTRYFYQVAGKQREENTGEVQAERRKAEADLEQILNQLTAPDVVIDNPEIFYLHRVNDGQDVYFFVNSTMQPQSARVTLRGSALPMLWDPSTGSQRVITPASVDGETTSFPLHLPAAGSAFAISSGSSAEWTVTETNLTIDTADGNQISGYGRVQAGSAVIRAGETQRRLEASAGPLAEPVRLDGVWKFTAQDENALVIGRWLAAQEKPGEPGLRAAALNAEAPAGGWLEMVPGAWSYQLPAEPDQPYPLPVWYRIPFHISDMPEALHLIIDGYAGSGWELYVNGGAVTDAPTRSAIDSQMKTVDITRFLHLGSNLISLRLVVTGPTDGLLDLVKLTGDFRLDARTEGGWTIAAPRAEMAAAAWTDQGYPFYSGCGSYQRSFLLPPTYAGQRVFIKPEMVDDVLEVIVNGQTAGVRLWPPYEIEITDLLKEGENDLELRVANTLVNLLEATPRPSGLAGAPEITPFPVFSFILTEDRANPAQTRSPGTMHSS